MDTATETKPQLEQSGSRREYMAVSPEGEVRHPTDAAEAWHYTTLGWSLFTRTVTRTAWVPR